jgi:ribosome-associated toxin RatA of RatAB toxin-antitoxin module
MPDYTGSASAIVQAPATDVYALMLDYERLPDWMRSVSAAHAVARDEDGRATEVAYEVDVRVATVHYTLRHTYEPPKRISSVYVEGDFRDCTGQWTFREMADHTTEVCFELRIDPGQAIPRAIVRMMNRRVMKGSVEDLRRHFAGGAERTGANEPWPRPGSDTLWPR